jgi:Domain of unknown function (DUF4062)
MHVFLSSTIYDLVDARAELYGMLRSLGVSVLMSDEKLSDFHVKPDANSIETCLINVERADVVIVVLSQRYGPRLGSFGFDDVSATHLEYRRAKALRKPIHFYVRDRLEGEFSSWKKSKRKDDFGRVWAQDAGLFAFLQEHRLLRSKDNNWISIFTNTLDLKDAVRRHFEPILRPQRVVDAIGENRFPLFALKQDMDWMTMGTIPTLKIAVVMKNVGGSPAFNFSARWADESHKADTVNIMAPQQAFPCQLLMNLTKENEARMDLILEYDSALGVHVCETHEIYALVRGGANKSVVGGPKLRSRRFSESVPLTITIDKS